MNVLGQKLYKWTVTEDDGKKVRNTPMIEVTCECGQKRMKRKSDFISKQIPEKCSKCNIRINKLMPFCRDTKK
jgi:hypothetical protein